MIHFIGCVLGAVTLCPVVKLTRVLERKYRIFGEAYCPLFFVYLYAGACSREMSKIDLMRYC